MPNQLTIYFSMLFLLLGPASATADYDITVNIGGEQYYSNSKGSADTQVVSVDHDGSISIKTHKLRNSAQRQSSPKDKRFRLKNKAGSQKYKEIVAAAADKHRVDPKLVHAVIQAESAYNAKAVSSAGAVGLMQLMPGTARRFGVSDRTDPYQNIDGGTRYLRHLLDMFGSRLDLTLAAYNAGENAVIRYNHQIPPYAETRHYVSGILDSGRTAKNRSKKQSFRYHRPDPFKSWNDADYSWGDD